MLLSLWQIAVFTYTTLRGQFLSLGVSALCLGVKLFLVFSKSHFVFLHHVNAYSITIPQAGFSTLLARVMVDNMAGALW